MTDANISSAQSGGAERAPRKSWDRTCRECGAAFKAVRKAGAFCTPACRTNWSNRRNMRGAQLYDLYMAHRFEREAATEAGALAIMNRLAADWRDEDNRQRGGRKSWGDWREFLAQRPYLIATRLVKRWAGRQAVAAPKAKEASK